MSVSWNLSVASFVIFLLAWNGGAYCNGNRDPDEELANEKIFSEPTRLC